jgi:hypothetical protein
MADMEKTPLTEGELECLARAEQSIEKGLKHFLSVGDALTDIRERRLYRDKFETFEYYVQVRWNMTHRRANQIIAGAETARLIAAESGNHGSQTTDEPPAERVLRPLTSLPKGERASAFREAQAEAAKTGSSVNVDLVQKVVAKRKASGGGKPAMPYDAFNDGIDEVISMLRKAGRRLNEVLEADANTKQLKGRWAGFYSHTGTIGTVNALIMALERGKPAGLTEQSPGFKPAFQIRSDAA